MTEAKQWEMVVIDQDICIGCNACVAVCPYQALEMDQENKAALIFDKCKDSFDCIPVCPVTCIWKSGEAPEESKEKEGWVHFSKPKEQLSEEEKQLYEQWKAKYGIKHS